jgi:teichoic acid transport system permease protein
MELITEAYKKISWFSHKGYIGAVWYVADTIFLFSIFTFLRGVIDFNIGELYPLYLLIGVSMFNFFRKASIQSLNTVKNIDEVQGLGFLKVVRVPVVHMLFLHMLEVMLILIALLYFNISLVGIIFYILFILAVAVFVAFVGAFLLFIKKFWSNIRQAWMLLMRGLFIVTPVFYFVENEPFFVAYNPIYIVVKTGRELLMYGVVSIYFYLILSLAVLLLLLGKLLMREKVA